MLVPIYCRSSKIFFSLFRLKIDLRFHNERTNERTNMDIPGLLSDLFQDHLDMNSFLSARINTPAVKAHVSSVYLLLTKMMIVTAFASWTYANYAIAHSSHSLSFFGLLGVLLAFQFTDPKNVTVRTNLLYAFAFLKGISLAPMLEYLSINNPEAVWIATSTTAVLFASFTAAAFYKVSFFIFTT